ncbi:hypothetical protein CYMTET_37809 [Cymbomonas tetramitiformis]|uniref:Uncharacterized protein n=1 Tax=Cymbomonas tetramitiformis TaxID=36881 RepID=A0AAE0CEI6_9CHLO|nr:hypothetical protein CYMTET_37809 [Cymbomonas tetramitiformis]
MLKGSAAFFAWLVHDALLVITASPTRAPTTSPTVAKYVTAPSNELCSDGAGAVITSEADCSEAKTLLGYTSVSPSVGESQDSGTANDGVYQYAWNVITASPTRAPTSPTTSPTVAKYVLAPSNELCSDGAGAVITSEADCSEAKTLLGYTSVSPSVGESQDSGTANDGVYQYAWNVITASPTRAPTSPTTSPTVAKYVLAPSNELCSDSAGAVLTSEADCSEAKTLLGYAAVSPSVGDGQDSGTANDGVYQYAWNDSGTLFVDRGLRGGSYLLRRSILMLCASGAQNCFLPLAPAQELVAKSQSA